MEPVFSIYHPAVNFLFFAGAIIFGMFFIHPVYIAISIGLSTCFWLLLTGKKGLKYVFGMLGVFAAVAVLNAIFNTRGDTVLFRYFGRPFALESLLYGCATAGIFVTVMNWFACYNRIMTEDKFTYLFGRISPSVSLVLCMVLRFVPHYSRQIKTITGARKCVGKSTDEAAKKEKLYGSMTVLSAMTTWALENSAVMADSMQSRGYGTGERTQFSIYSFGARDKTVMAVLAASAACLIACIAKGAAKAEFLPTINFAADEKTIICAAVVYGIFLSVPSVLQVLENITWHILRSKI
ncbi:MAG: energy-coupling factor transporter transmembrane component T family protein [Eubacterium sp.]|jgi:energy-coupling factor transport system permease protein